MPLKEVIARPREADHDDTPLPSLSRTPNCAAVHGARAAHGADAAALGYFMRSNKERIVNGMWFERRQQPGKDEVVGREAGWRQHHPRRRNPVLEVAVIHVIHVIHVLARTARTGN